MPTVSSWGSVFVKPPTQRHGALMKAKLHPFVMDYHNDESTAAMRLLGLGKQARGQLHFQCLRF